MRYERILLILLAVACAAQDPAFEAASIKPSKADDSYSWFNTRTDNIETKNMPLREILVSAFQIKEYQLFGPDWLSSERFDIVAKAPLGTGDDEKLMPLLRTLVTQRFRLQIHHEKRDLPSFALIVAKGGFRPKEVETGPSSLSGHSNDGAGELKATKVGMESVAEWLSRQVERPVLDMTGLKGSYDFTLKYSKENTKGVTESAEFPIVTLAIQQQLGLRLEKRTQSVDVVVIDHAERVPVEN